MIKKIDNHGRIYFPKKFRNKDFPKPGDYVEFKLDSKEGKIYMEKAFPFCLVCQKEDHLVEISEGSFLCVSCAHKLFSHLF